MFEILHRNWNLKPIFTQKWASVETRTGGGGSTPNPGNSNPVVNKASCVVQVSKRWRHLSCRHLSWSVRRRSQPPPLSPAALVVIVAVRWRSVTSSVTMATLRHRHVLARSRRALEATPTRRRWPMTPPHPLTWWRHCPWCLPFYNSPPVKLNPLPPTVAIWVQL